MEIFTAGVDIVKGIVTLIGGAMAIMGLFQLFSGFSESNGSAKVVGFSLFIAGAGIVTIGQTLIPMLANGI